MRGGRGGRGGRECRCEKKARMMYIHIVSTYYVHIHTIHPYTYATKTKGLWHLFNNLFLICDIKVTVIVRQQLKNIKAYLQSGKVTGGVAPIHQPVWGAVHLQA